MNELTETEMQVVRRIAGGNLTAPRSVREAAIRIVTGFNDEYDFKIITDYIDNL